MHRLIKIRIMRDYESLEERVRVWRDVFLGLKEAPAGFRPHADLLETSQGLVLRLEVPGVDPDELSLCLAGHELIVRGRRRSRPPEGARRFLLRELLCGPFERSFLLPISVDSEKIQARCADGILEVLLPRSAPRRIPVKDFTQDQD
jgi:HSP20 family protein